MTTRETVNAQLLQLLAQRAQIDEGIVKGRAMLEALDADEDRRQREAAEAEKADDERSDADNGS